MTLLDTLRRMVGAATDEYTIGTDTYWSDEQLQDALDQNSYRIPNAAIHKHERSDLTVLDGQVDASGSFQPGTEGDTGVGEITRWGGGVIEGWSIDTRGQVTFASNVLGIPLRFDGTTYDLNAAAADVLEAWAAHVKLHYDVTADGQGMSRSQKHKQILEQAANFRARSLPQSVRMHAGEGHHGQRGRYRAFFDRRSW